MRLAWARETPIFQKGREGSKKGEDKQVGGVHAHGWGILMEAQPLGGR